MRVGAAGGEEACLPTSEASWTRVSHCPAQPGLGLKQPLPALPFSFTLVFNPKVKLKAGTLWERC